MKKISRRGFLKESAVVTAALGFPYIVPSSALGLAGSVAPSERIVTGSIGVGSMGGGHLRTFLGMPDVHVAAVCDVRQSAVARAKERVDGRYGDSGCAGYGDFRELLARDDIDAIVNATPDHWHVLIGLEAARNGKDMYYEKPFGMSVEEGKVLRGEIQRTGCVFQFGTQQRSSYNFRFACELARNKKIGELRTVVLGGVGGWGREDVPPEPEPMPEPVPAGFDYDMWLGPAPWAPYSERRCSRSWGSIRDYSLGGLGGAWGVHDVDIAQWVCDADDSGPTEVEGTGEVPSDGLATVVTRWTVRHRYANGVEMLHMDAKAVRDYMKDNGYPELPWMGVMFIGSEGWVFASRRSIFAKPSALLRTALGPDDRRLYFSNNHARNFIDCVRSRRRTICPVESAVRSDTVCHLDDMTIRLGRKLRWDPVKEEVVGDDEANRMLSYSMRAPWHL